VKKVLVTGASGFIGRQCLPLLISRGYEVHATSRRPPAFADNKVHWHSTDLLDRFQLAEVVRSVKPSHLLHLAWTTTPGRFWHSTENFRWVNASLDLMQEFKNSGGQRVVAAGSCAEYAWGREYDEIKTPLEPDSTYGICKNAFRQLLESFATLSDMTWAWGRVFFMFGPAEPAEKLAASVILSLLRDEVAKCSEGTQLRDFMYVGDVADAFATLLDSDFSGSVNIGSGIAFEVRKFASMIAERLDKRQLLELGALKSKNEPDFIVANVNRLKNELKWTPKISLENGIDETIEWYRRSLQEESSGKRRCN
jgi:nucleoside-diphosphate-sugar epimerase